MKFDIVLARFPFGDNFEVQKIRPLLCLTEPIGQHEEIVLAYITSNLEIDPTDYDVLLESRREPFLQTGLKHDSIVRLHKVVTMPKDRLSRKLGVLPPSMHPKVNTRLKSLILS